MSRVRSDALIALVVAGVLMAPALGRSQGAGGPSATDPLTTLKVGHWIKLEGAARGASPAPCNAVKVLTGDFLDDDWSLKGIVTAVDTERREFNVGTCRVQITENTVYDSDRRDFKTFADLRPGTYVEVDGTFLKNQTFLATEVADESDEIARQPRLRDQIELVGRIERVDLRKRVISIMGMDFQVTTKTQLRSVIR